MPNDICELAELSQASSNKSVNDASRPSPLRHYEAIARASCAMLEAARQGDWAEVTRLEERCCALIATLKTADLSLSQSDDAVRMQLLRQMLADDAQIREHAEPWLGQIATYISSKPALGDEPK